MVKVEMANTLTLAFHLKWAETPTFNFVNTVLLNEEKNSFYCLIALSEGLKIRCGSPVVNRPSLTYRAKKATPLFRRYHTYSST